MSSRTNHIMLVTVVALSVCSGCALVPFPVTRTLPDPIRKIQVVQDGSVQPIANAEVVVYAERFKNWSRSFSPYCTAGFTPAGENSVVVSLSQLADGCFIPEARKVFRYVRPWGIGPLGFVIHEDYVLKVSVRAEGYRAVTAMYCPAGDMNPSLEITQGTAPVSFPQFGPDGTLTVLLRPEIAEPDCADNSHRTGL